MPRFKLLYCYRILFYSVLVLGCLLAFSPANNGLHSLVNDKLLHGAGFCVLALLSSLAHPNVAPWKLIVALSLFGLGIEIIQAYLPYRSFSVWDWLADIIGLLAYFVAINTMIEAVARRDKSLPD